MPLFFTAKKKVNSIKAKATKLITIIDLSGLNSAIERAGKRPHELTGKKCSPESRHKLEIIKKYCVGRDDAFVVRYDGENWFKVEKKVSDDVIIGYIKGEYDLALYPQYQNKRNDKKREKWRCRWLGIDVDCHDEHFTPENMKALSKSCDILISNCKEFFLFDDHKYIIKERSAHGWHLLIPLKKGTLQEDAVFCRDITFNNINKFFKERHEFIDIVEIYPENLIGKGGYGHALKPFFNKFSDLDGKVEIYELNLNQIIKDRKDKYNQYVLNSKKSYSQKTVNSINIYTEKTDFCEWEKIHKNSLKYFLSEYYGGQCIKNVINGIYQCSGTVGHKMRIKVVNKLNYLGYSEDIIIQAFKNQKDFDYNKTKKDVKNLMSRNYSPPSCKTTRALGYCDKKNCPKAKPVFLEYNCSETLSQEIKGFDGVHRKMASLIFSFKKKRGYLRRYFVRKTTRSGTTTTTFVQSAKLRMKMLMIAPTKRIFDETLLENGIVIGFEKGYLNAFTNPHCYRICSNLESCDKVKESIEGIEDITTVLPFLLKQPCSKCERNNFWESKVKKDPDAKRCGFQDFLNNLNTYDTIYLSTQKFKNLINASKHSSEAKDLLDMLIDWCDFVFFDECYNLLSVNFNDYELYSIDENDNENDNLVKVFKVIQKLKERKPDSHFLDELAIFLRKVDNKVKNDFLCVDKSKYEEIPKSWYENILKDKIDWSKWYSIMVNYFKETKDRKIKNLVEIYCSLSSKQLYIQQQITFLSGKSPKERRIILGCVDDIPTFINWTKKLKKPFIMTDAVKPPIDLNMLFNDVEEVNINDPNETAKKQTIVICQQYDPFYKGIEPNKQIIIDFLKKYGLEKEVFLVTQSKKYNKYINYILKDNTLTKLKLGENTYHGSDACIGTASRLRRMICIGSSFIPRHSYDYVAEVYKKLGYFPSDFDTEKIANVLENHEARARFFQTCSRIKDPFGKEKSEAFIFGMKGQVIADWFKSLGIGVPEITSEKSMKKDDCERNQFKYKLRIQKKINKLVKN